MANLIEEPKWEEGVYQFTRGDFLEGGEDGIDNVPTRQLANRTQFLKEYIDSFIDKIPQALLPPVKLDLESELPDISELTSKDIGLFYIIQNMDISAEGKTGKAWLNYEDGDNANDLIWYKSFDQYYSADGVSIILTPTGKLQVGLDWFNSILESSDIVADIEEIKTALTLSANDPLLSYTPTGSLQSQIGFNVVDEKLEVTGRNGMLIASIDIPKGAGGGIEDAPYEEIITPGSPETSATIGDWTPGTVPATSLTSVCYGNGLFVAVGGGNNRIITSPDGITWTARTAAEANQWRSVCYGNGLFVAVSGDGANQVMTSSDGITWTARTVPFDSWSSVTYGNGLFVAVSSIGISVVMTSPDGITWTARTALPNSWRSVTYGNGLFVVVSTSMFMTSIDGIAWTAHWAPLREFWISIAYGNGLFVAVAQTGTHRVVTSPDGITWTARTVPFDSWSSVTYGNGLFVAVSGDGANQVMTSSDGITWTARTALPNSWRSVTYGNGLFVAVSGDGANQVMTSPLIPATPEVPAVVERRYPLHLRRYKEWVEFDSVQAFDSARLGGKLADEFGTREWVREEIEKGGGGSGNVDSVDGVYPDTSVDPDNKNVELFKHITKEELEAMQADPSLAQDGVKYICVDESSRGVVTTMMPDYANR
ncbi:MAG: hypothetical protein FWE02_03865, partial [Defluviitaleaceae bacterium]|nr:hypothetical protein [Defluviitaleaceae bacterium]